MHPILNTLLHAARNSKWEAVSQSAEVLNDIINEQTQIIDQYKAESVHQKKELERIQHRNEELEYQKKDILEMLTNYEHKFQCRSEELEIVQKTKDEVQKTKDEVEFKLNAMKKAFTSIDIPPMNINHIINSMENIKNHYKDADLSYYSQNIAFTRYFCETIDLVQIGMKTWKEDRFELDTQCLQRLNVLITEETRSIWVSLRQGR